MKLTQNQILGLAEVEAGSIFKTQTGSGSWRISDDIVAAVVFGRLTSMGLIEWRKVDDRLIAKLTPAGKQALDTNVTRQHVTR